MEHIQSDFPKPEFAEAACLPAPEVLANMNTIEVGRLGLTAGEEADVVAFLKTLSDGYRPCRSGHGDRCGY